MKKDLQITMILWSAIGILFGLEFHFAPGLLYATAGLQKMPAVVTFFLALLGNGYIVSGIFVLLATRDPQSTCPPIRQMVHGDRGGKSSRHLLANRP